MIKFDREYLEYRVQPPIIPLQEVILRDLFFIEENPNLDPERESWVNFDKMAMLGKGTGRATFWLWNNISSYFQIWAIALISWF